MNNPANQDGSMDELCRLARELDIPFTDGSAPTSRFLAANGLRLHALDWGRNDDKGQDKPAIVFLHGASMTAHTWDLLCLSLRDDYHCIALDQRGHGLTDGQHAFGVEKPRADILGAVQALGLQRFALVGMSLGGNNAIAYAGAHPDTLAAAVFVDICPSVLRTAYKDGDAHNAAIAKTGSLDEAVEASHRHNPRGSKDYKRYQLSFSTERGADGRYRMLYEKNIAPLKPAAERAAIMTERRDTLWSLVPKIQCPALVIHGRDSLSQNHENLEQFRSQLPDARLVQIVDSSHYVQEDQPRALLVAIREFLAGVPY